jgi:hypothetical protein
MVMRAKRFFRSFLSGTDGNVSVEFVLVMPFLFWAFMAAYVFFDGYRQSTLNVKAAYTISDLISRETEYINDDYIDSMQKLIQLMTRAESKTKLRVTVVRWDKEDNQYYVDWSKTRGYSNPRTDTSIKKIAHKLPTMPDNERVILVETFNKYVPLYGIGMKPKKLKNLVFTRPRFAPQVKFSNDA